MFSRSQAKAFFVVGTALASFAFLGLTVDTFRQIPALTHSETLAPEVIHGKHLFDRNNCMGCHTLLGEGGYYAPELTKVYERRGPEFIRAMLRDPESMYPGQRKMQRYEFSDEEMNALIAFLKWVGEMNLNGFPVMNTVLKVAVPEGNPAVARTVSQPQVFSQMCLACHSMEGQGGNVGPALDGVGDRKSKEELIEWLTDPVKVKPGTLMPKLPLTKEDIIELAAYLTLQKKSNEKQP